MTNFQAPMTNESTSPNSQFGTLGYCDFIRHSDLDIGKFRQLITSKIKINKWGAVQ